MLNIKFLVYIINSQLQVVTKTIKQRAANYAYLKSEVSFGKSEQIIEKENKKKIFHSCVLFLLVRSPRYPIVLA